MLSRSSTCEPLRKCYIVLHHLHIHLYVCVYAFRHPVGSKNHFPLCQCISGSLLCILVPYQAQDLLWILLKCMIKIYTPRIDTVFLSLCISYGWILHILDDVSWSMLFIDDIVLVDDIVFVVHWKICHPFIGFMRVYFSNIIDVLLKAK